MRSIFEQFLSIKNDKIQTRLKHLRGKHDQLDHAWNRGMGQGDASGGRGRTSTGLAPNQMGPLPTQNFYRRRLAELAEQRRNGLISRAEMRRQMRELRGITTISSDSLTLANINKRPQPKAKIGTPSLLAPRPIDASEFGPGSKFYEMANDYAKFRLERVINVNSINEASALYGQDLDTYAEILKSRLQRFAFKPIDIDQSILKTLLYNNFAHIFEKIQESPKYQKDLKLHELLKKHSDISNPNNLRNLYQNPTNSESVSKTDKIIKALTQENFHRRYMYGFNPDLFKPANIINHRDLAFPIIDTLFDGNKAKLFYSLLYDYYDLANRSADLTIEDILSETNKISENIKRDVFDVNENTSNDVLNSVNTITENLRNNFISNIGLTDPSDPQINNFEFINSVEKNPISKEEFVTNAINGLALSFFRQEFAYLMPNIGNGATPFLALQDYYGLSDSDVDSMFENQNPYYYDLINFIQFHKKINLIQEIIDHPTSYISGTYFSRPGDMTERLTENLIKDPVTFFNNINDDYIDMLRNIEKQNNEVPSIAESDILNRLSYQLFQDFPSEEKNIMYDLWTIEGGQRSSILKTQKFDDLDLFTQSFFESVIKDKISPTDNIFDLYEKNIKIYNDQNTQIGEEIKKNEDIKELSTLLIEEITRDIGSRNLKNTNVESFASYIQKEMNLFPNIIMNPRQIFLSLIYDMQNYNNKPTVLPSEDIVNPKTDVVTDSEGNPLVFYRSVGPSRADITNSDPTEYVNQMRYGEEHFPGTGVSGYGTYMKTQNLFNDHVSEDKLTVPVTDLPYYENTKSKIIGILDDMRYIVEHSKVIDQDLRINYDNLLNEINNAKLSIENNTKFSSSMMFKPVFRGMMEDDFYNLFLRFQSALQLFQYKPYVDRRELQATIIQNIRSSYGGYTTAYTVNSDAVIPGFFVNHDHNMTSSFRDVQTKDNDIDREWASRYPMFAYDFDVGLKMAMLGWDMYFAHIGNYSTNAVILNRGILNVSSDTVSKDDDVTKIIE